VLELDRVEWNAPNFTEPVQSGDVTVTPDGQVAVLAAPAGSIVTT
jgi:hypothetical protein